MANTTIYDIAKETGLSPATVSKALNNYKSVSEKTKKLVLETAERMDFTPNHVAQSLATQSSKLIGVAYMEENDYGLSHPHFMDILQSFKNEVEKNGYDVLFLNKNFEQSNDDFYKHSLYRRVDGVLLAIPNLYSKTIDKFITGNIPIVSVESIYDHYPTVLSDNYNGIKKILEYLYSLGHRKIAYLSGPLYSLAGKERYEAYRDFVKEKNLPVTEAHTAYVNSYVQEDAAAATENLLSTCWDDLPTAIATAYDEFAYAALETLTKRGYHIPKDISVTGFDNIIISQCTNPKLTTMEQNRKEIGSLAAKLLLEQLSNPDKKPSNCVKRIPTKLIVRDSTVRINPNPV